MWWTLKETGNALPFHFCPIRLNGLPDWSDITVCTKELIHASVHATYKPNVQVSNQARYHARVLRCFPDPLIAWTFYCSSDSLSTELQGHCIAREIWIHTVHHPLSPFIVQTATRPSHCRHHTILKSLFLYPFYLDPWFTLIPRSSDLPTLSHRSNALVWLKSSKKKKLLITAKQSFTLTFWSPMRQLVQPLTAQYLKQHILRISLPVRNKDDSPNRLTPH